MAQLEICVAVPGVVVGSAIGAALWTTARDLWDL
jgi:hypothetical protein